MFRERYGLEIVNAIAKASQGKKKIGFSSLYPNLRKLEKRGFVTSRWGDETPEESTGARRRYYKITGSGVAAVKHKQEFLTSHFQNFKNTLVEFKKYSSLAIDYCSSTPVGHILPF